jgi:hypothetical protein
METFEVRLHSSEEQHFDATIGDSLKEKVTDAVRWLDSKG